MKECWINVYSVLGELTYGIRHYNVKSANEIIEYLGAVKVLYRIHVKMKDQPTIHQKQFGFKA